MTVLQDVNVAAMIMDEHYPDWYKNIPEDFNVLQASNCILYHTTGNFKDTYMDLMSKAPQLVAKKVFTCIGMTADQIRELNDAWRTEMAGRRGHTTTAPERELVTA